MCRPAQMVDIPWLVETTLAAYRTVFAPLLPACDWSAFDGDWFAERFKRQWPDVMIAEVENGPVGFCLMTDANIDMLFIAEGCRRNGTGLVLLRQAEARGARTLECFAVNVLARQFYARHGWTSAGSQSRVFAGSRCEFVSYHKA
jgi:putative acetyltransferase